MSELRAEKVDEKLIFFQFNIFLLSLIQFFLLLNIASFFLLYKCTHMSVKDMTTKFQKYYVKDTGVSPAIKEVVILLTNSGSISAP